MPLSPGLVGALGTIGGSALSGLGSLGSSLVGHKSSVELAEKMNQYNLEQWNRENAYNTPKAQMERFKQAGLNPNLLIGQQNLSAPSPQMVSGNPLDLSPLVGDIRQGSLIDSQINLNNANAEKLREQAGLFSSQVDLNSSKEELNRQFGAKIAEEIENLKVKRENILAQAELFRSQSKYTDIQAIGAEIDNGFKAEKNRAQIDELNALCAKHQVDAQRVMTLMYAELNNLNAESEYYKQASSKEKMMAGVLANTFRQGKIDVDFIENHPGLHSFGNGAKEIIPSVTALGNLIGNVADLIFPTKRLVNVVKP